VVLVGDVWLGGLQLESPSPQVLSQTAPVVVEEGGAEEAVESAAAQVEGEADAASTTVAMAPQVLPTATLRAAPTAVVEEAPAVVVAPEAEVSPVVGVEATASAVVMPQTRTSEVAVAEGAAPTEPAGVGAGSEPPGEPAPTEPTDEVRAAIVVPTEPVTDRAHATPVPSAPPGVVEQPSEAAKADATAALALAPVVGAGTGPAAEPQALRQEPPVDWLTVMEITLAVVVVFLGSATLLVSLRRRAP
jgi:hypothetical protein